MGWSCGYDTNWKRDIGYGVPATCDHPGCGEEIDRGLYHVCGSAPYGAPYGCGLYFCGSHLFMCETPWGYEDGGSFCQRCSSVIETLERDEDGVYEFEVTPFEPTPDVAEWFDWKLTDESWANWRDENPDEVTRMRAAVKALVS